MKTGLLAIFKTHTYKFAEKVYLQMKDGPISKNGDVVNLTMETEDIFDDKLPTLSWRYGQMIKIKSSSSSTRNQ